jgi:hypothetical protein
MLLAAIVATTSRRHAGLKAGLAIGAAALMRYQSGLVAPFLSLAILLDRERPDARRQAMSCFLTAAGAGGAIVALNYWLYGSATGIVKGVFGVEYLAGNALYYGVALNALWPLMLLVALFGRSRIRAVSAAVWGPLLVFFLIYYFIDVGTGPLQTLVLGLRLMQVALPALIAAYAAALGAGMLPLLKPKIPAATAALAVVACLTGMAAVTGVMFARHQEHLRHLLAARQAIIEAIPTGATLFTNTTAEKLVGVPYHGVPAYRLRVFEEGAVRARRAIQGGGWYVALHEKEGLRIDPETLAFLEGECACRPLPAAPSGLRLYRCGTSDL